MLTLSLKRTFVFFALAAVILAGCSNEKANTTKKFDTRNLPPNTVFIQDYTFVPAKLTVKKGTTVMWKNTDTASHTVTADNSGSAGPDSKLLKTNEDYKFTFTKEGTFDYHCAPHPYMKASIEVVK